MDEYVAKHAIVIGASVAGLTAARALLNHVERVTIVERDHLPQDPEFRAGVPHARHNHVLLKRGELIFEEIFPGFRRELLAAGAPLLNWTSDMRWYHIGGYRVEYASDFDTPVVSRYMLEAVLRRRINALSRVRILEGSSVTGLLTDAARKRVTGVKLRRNDSSGGGAVSDVEEQASLVVDASGRESKVPVLLEALGYPAPRESQVNASAGYVSRRFRRPPGFEAKWKAVAIFPTPPVNQRFGHLIPIETGEWSVSIGGTNGDYPPHDDAGFLEFAKSLGKPDIYEAIKNAESTSPIYSWRKTDNFWRHYEKLSPFPEGVFVLGDSFCALNPVYGQGMTTAAMGAAVLDGCLREHGARARSAGIDGLSRRFHSKLASVMKLPWSMAVGEDLRYPATVGSELSMSVKMTQAYLDRVATAAAQSTDAHRTFMEVFHLCKSPAYLFRPAVLWAALAQRGLGSANADLQ